MLVSGQLSLSMTFWGWGFCGGLFIGLMGIAGIRTEHVALVPLVYILKVILFSAVLSGLTFILRKKITILGTLAFLITLLHVVMCGVMIVGLFPLLYK